MPDTIYRERAHLVAHLAAIYPAVVWVDPDEPDWPVVAVELSTGQAAWHIAPADMHLFAHVPRGENRWDGHSTSEKYDRIDEATRLLSERPGVNRREGVAE
ncbi:hypothetical protein [Nocardia asiatica]|uniref:WDGH domain-containing protein n=1 Tax=Nocardia asiatica TaxID=209252 RepID=UPI0024583BFE|nr:hypothetical protein [Nocardia asiatica]